MGGTFSLSPSLTQARLRLQYMKPEQIDDTRETQLISVENLTQNEILGKIKIENQDILSIINSGVLEENNQVSHIHFINSNCESLLHIYNLSGTYYERSAAFKVGGNLPVEKSGLFTKGAK